jgi:hypothetical protein
MDYHVSFCDYVNRIGSYNTVDMNIVGTGVMGYGQGEFQLPGKTEQCMTKSLYIRRL